MNQDFQEELHTVANEKMF